MARSRFHLTLRHVARFGVTSSTPLRLALIAGLLASGVPTAAFAQSVCDQTGGTPPTATGGSAFACGDGATADGGTSTAIGTDAASTGDNSTAVGALSNSAGEFSTAIGRSATSLGSAATALGFNSAASGDNALAFGANSSASAANASAIGTDAVASGADSTAIGNAASATAANAVALGANSVADEDNTVSVGAAGAERKVTNVAAGENDTDAVNVSQLNDTVAASADTTLQSANAYTDQQIALIGGGGGGDGGAAAVEQLRGEMNDRFAGVDDRLDAIDESLRKMDRRLSRQGAMAAAYNQTAGMPDVGANWLGVGVGGYEGETAFAVTLRRRFNTRTTGSIGAATSGGETSYGVGLGFTWGGN